MQAAKPRWPVGAALLSLLLPGLGQLYNGAPSRASVFYIIFFVGNLLVPGLATSSTIHSSATFVLVAVLAVPVLGFYLFVIVDAYRGARRTGQLELRSYNSWYVYVLLYCVNYGLSTAIDHTPIHAQSHSNPPSSMAPTFLPGDRVATAANAYQWKLPERGDVVVFEIASRPGAITVRRLVGMPGDRIQIKGGILHINDVTVTRERVADREQAATLPEGFETATMYEEVFTDRQQHSILEISDTASSDNTQVYEVPPGHYFVLGDNRDASTDSRISDIGFVPHENLRGRVLYVWWARDWSRIGAVVE